MRSEPFSSQAGIMSYIPVNTGMGIMINNGESKPIFINPGNIITEI